MKLFKNFKNNIYLNRTDKIVYHERVFKLQEECSKLDMFINVNEHTPDIENGKNPELYCFYEEGEKIGSIISKKTYYFIHGNTCIIYHKSGYDRIIRILVKTPEEAWEFYREMDKDKLYHIKTETKYVEVYDWWDVDWMQCGKSNCDSCSKEGYWWKTIYNDICGIYEKVAQKSIDYVFNSIYCEYEKMQKV